MIRNKFELDEHSIRQILKAIPKTASLPYLRTSKITDKRKDY